ncbi:MAG: FAD-dependent oxidoreductase, partial [Acidimicrobiia bacterium]|nr:FAD-dependent oxidoreductase [Acidimicrobiia bacterium]
MTRIAVVGGGIAGLAAAHHAVRAGAEVTLFEAEPAVGGKLRTSPFAGLPIDESADAFLARVPWAYDLCREIGLADELVSPATSTAQVWLDEQLRDLPRDSVLGVPLDIDLLRDAA